MMKPMTLYMKISNTILILSIVMAMGVIGTTTVPAMTIGIYFLTVSLLPKE